MLLTNMIHDAVLVTESLLKDSRKRKHKVTGVIIELKDGGMWFYGSEYTGKDEGIYAIKEPAVFLRSIAPLSEVNAFLNACGFQTDKMSLIDLYTVYSAIRNPAAQELVIGLWDFPNTIQGYGVVAEHIVNASLPPLHFGVLNNSPLQLKEDPIIEDYLTDNLMSSEGIRLKLSPVFSFFKEGLKFNSLSSRPINGMVIWKTPGNNGYGFYRIPTMRDSTKILLQNNILEKSGALREFINLPERTAPLIQRFIKSNVELLERENKLIANRRAAKLLIKILDSKYPLPKEVKITREEVKAKKSIKKPAKKEVITDRYAKTKAAPERPAVIPLGSANAIAEEAKRIMQRKKQSLAVDMIVGGTRDFVIGKNNDLPWHIPEDLAFFKQFTKNAILIMGRNTYDSLPKPLLNRHLIVISSKPDQLTRKFENVPTSFVRSYDDALLEAVMLRLDDHKRKVIVIGGGKIYAEAQHTCDRLIYVFNNQTVEGHRTELVKYKPHDSMILAFESPLPTKNHGELTVSVYNNASGRLR